jgi:hypothetical protein
MAYENIPGVKATYLDGSFRTPTGSTQPKILVVAPAESGLSFELFNVANVRQAETEFGADTDLLKGVHEAVAQRADNVAVMRIGGTQGSLVLTDSAGGTLTITPEIRDDEAMDRYALILDGSGSENRIVVWDLLDEQFVYDSAEVLVLDEGTVEVVDTGLDLFSVGTLNDLTTYVSFADLVVGDFTAEGSATMATVVPTQGTDGQSGSLVEKYAALNTAYHLLDYRDADFVVPQGVYVDDANVVDSDAVANFFKGVPVAGSETDELGYVWQYIYRGKIYTYFTDSATYFTDLDTADFATATVDTDVVLTAAKTGVGGNGITYEATSLASGPTPIVTISEPDAESLSIVVQGNASDTTADVVTAINDALEAFTMANGELASTLVVATGGSGAAHTATEAETPLAGGLGSHALTHAELTGDTVPSDVTARFAAGQDAELREVNFAHQLGSFLEKASTTWKAMLGSISFKEPVALSRLAISNWAGSAAIYTIGPDGKTLIIDAPADNGSGILGNKFLAGMADAAGGFRNDAIPDAASSTDGLAFGGFIKTVGASLPNAADFPGHSYGVDSADEAKDSNNRPIDLGKHLLITYDWPIHRNAFNGGTAYRGTLSTLLVAKVATLPENQEPIGVNGRIGGITAPPRVHATQQDQLARIRAIGLRREDGVGLIVVSARTAAHPDSDWARLSTIRSVNRELEGIRRIAKPYIGKEFSAQKLVALQGAIDGYLQAERKAGFNQGARASISFNRSDRIVGRLKIKLRMVPPFSIETIDVETSLAADETEL